MAAESWRPPIASKSTRRSMMQRQNATHQSAPQAGEAAGRARPVRQVTSFLIPVYCFPIPFGVSAYLLLTFPGGTHVKGTCPACPSLRLLANDAELGHAWTCGRPAAQDSDVRFNNTATQRLRDSAGAGRERLTARNLHGHESD